MKNRKLMKIMMVEHHSPGNRYVLELARELKKDCDLTIYCNKHADFEDEGIHWLPRFYDGGKGKAGAILDYGLTLKDLYKEIRYGHYDVLHIQSFKRASTEMKLYYKLRPYYKALVMTVHNVLPHEPAKGDQALYGAFYQICDLLIVHNEASKQELIEIFEIDDSKIRVIPRGLYTTYEINPLARDDDPRKHFLCFGRIRPYKGVDILLKAIAELPPEDRAKCLFIIRGEQYPKLDPTDYYALIQKYHIEDCVEFSNQRVPEEEIPGLMGNTDAMIFPYRKIYGSGVLMMSYTYRIPIIASDVPTFVEGTDEGEAGILFRSEDPADLKRAILEVIDWDEKKTASCKESISRIVAKRHSWKVTAANTVHAYKSIMNRNMFSVRKTIDTGPIDALLLETADAHYILFDQLGHAVPGRNGPYGGKDTPVRNTGHWLIIYAYLWRITGKEKYRRIALKFSDYLVELQTTSRSGAVPCMEDGKADHLNGLIGQAWTIEALIGAYKTFGKTEYLKSAVGIFKSQQFDPNMGLWKRVEPDGTVLGFDLTLNHQVWFGIAGLMILSCFKDPEIKLQVKKHLKRVRNEYFGIHKDGLIRHFGAMKRPRKAFNILYIKQYVKYAGLASGLLKSEKANIIEQEIGYHIFELYGYAHIALLKKHDSLFLSKDFKKALDYVSDINSFNRKLGISEPLTMNKYAYGYNSPAFEWPLVQLVFEGKADENIILSLLKKQMDMTWSEKNKAFDRNNDDPETLTARLYEYVLFCDCCRK